MEKWSTKLQIEIGAGTLLHRKIDNSNNMVYTFLKLEYILKCFTIKMINIWGVKYVYLGANIM